ncbi:MAG: hypothetical protein ACLQVI_18775 [Polyangiaceae bacterium]
MPLVVLDQCPSCLAERTGRLAKPFSAAELAAVVEKLAGGAHVSPSGAERAAVTIATVGPRDTER